MSNIEDVKKAFTFRLGQEVNTGLNGRGIIDMCAIDRNSFESKYYVEFEKLSKWVNESSLEAIN